MPFEGYDEGYTDGEKFLLLENCELDYRYRYIVTQYTGLKDKNNQKIYEEDIVKRISMGPGGFDFVGTVKYIDGMFVLDNGKNSIPLFTEADELVIIGNYFEEENTYEQI